jgi:hypothetical protein
MRNTFQMFDQSIERYTHQDGSSWSPHPLPRKNLKFILSIFLGNCYVRYSIRERAWSLRRMPSPVPKINILSTLSLDTCWSRMGGREKSIKFINNLCKLRLLHESSHKDQAHDERTVEVTQPLWNKKSTTQQSVHRSFPCTADYIGCGWEGQGQGVRWWVRERWGSTIVDEGRHDNVARRRLT